VKKFKIILSFSLVFAVVLTLMAGSFLVSPMPVLANNGNPHLVKTFPGPDGKAIDEVVFPVKPPALKVKSVIVPEPNIQAGINYISESVPAFDWSYGCSATSAAMLFGYYDLNGYISMYTGSTNSGICPLNNSVWGQTTYPSVTCGECPLSATHFGIDSLSSRGHVDDYWIDYGNNSSDPYLVNGWQQHISNSAGDFMGTNQSAWHNSDGATTFYFYTNGDPIYDYSGNERRGYRDGAHGMRLFAESKGYTVVTNFNQYTREYASELGYPTKGFTFANYMAEIDAGRPVLIQVSGHTMLGFGYNTTDNLIYMNNTWDYSPHEMTWGGIYEGMQHYGVTVFRLAAPAAPGAPVAAFSGSPLTGTAPLTVHFTDQSTNSPTSWTWNFGDNTATSSAQNPSHTYTSAGTYSVMLTVANAAGSNTLTRTNYITVNAPVTPDFSLSASPGSRNVSRGSSTTFTVTLTTSGGFNSPVGLSVSGLPNGATYTFSKNPLTSGTSILTVSTTRTTSTGTFPLIITGTSGSLTHSMTVSLKVR
jgi:PKD repeat protein